MKANMEMKRFYSIIPDTYIHNRDFFDYVTDKITTNQYRDIQKIKNPADVLPYLVYAYNCYVLVHNYGQKKLITNPETLFNHEIQEETFLLTFLNYIRDEIAEAQAMRNLRNSASSPKE